MADLRGVPKLRRNSSDRGGAFPELAALLWTVRESLETVLFKLTELGLILRTGSARWLARADSELRHALDDLQAIELLRATEVDDLTRTLGRSGTVSLDDIMQSAPIPWPPVFAEHRVALARLSMEIELVSQENRRLLVEGLRDGQPDESGGWPTRAELADPAVRASFQAALATSDIVAQVSLRDFLA